MKPEAREIERRSWLASCFDNLTTRIESVLPSEWAEAKRYLPPSNTDQPGYYSYSVTPYLKEVVDNFSPESPIREVSVIKGAQVGATVGILENIIGYLIDHVSTAPAMMITADAELAALRLDTNIIPMLNESGLADRIQSSDDSNKRKTGKTTKKLEWIGGGYLIPLGAQNAAKLRSASIRYLLRDEIDAWPTALGKDGDPLKLSEARTVTFENTRKILDLSTPLIKGQSKIEKAYLRGDQRWYYVKCLKCGEHQRLKWRRQDETTGEVTGIAWDTDDRGNLVPGSARYLCQFCSHPHTNNDKRVMFDPANGAEWRATAVPVAPWVRSYHLSALYSPVGAQSWDALVVKWLSAWDPVLNRPRDIEELQVFYNNVLAEPFTVQGERVRFEQVSPHKRPYEYGTIPNKFAKQHAGSSVQLLTLSVDVQAAFLSVFVFGWTVEKRAFLIRYEQLDGNTESLEDAATWGRLKELIEEVYQADDGTEYPIALSVIDFGYRKDQVLEFCNGYEAGVVAIKGLSHTEGTVGAKLFQQINPSLGQLAFGIRVDFYKERWSAALRRAWNGVDTQPIGHFNAPNDITDSQLKELTREWKTEKIDKRTKKRMGWEWSRHGRNELWDGLIYASAAVDILAWHFCCIDGEQDQVNWFDFWDHCASGAYKHTG